jgi:uncharacterized membrane protein YhaH (DUF805 family)
LSTNYCQGCGTSMMPTLRMCPQCGGRVFSSTPPSRSATLSPSEVRGPGVGAPNRQVEFGDAISLFFKNFVNFHGRSSRGAFWWWFLAATVGGYVIAFVLGLMAASSDTPQIVLLPAVAINLSLVIGGVALSVRRLHDTNRTGWWLLIGLVPLVGAIVLIIFYCTPGTRGPNTYGPDVEAGR